MGIFTGEAKRANILLNFNCNIAMVETAVLVQRQEQNSKGAYNLNIRGASSRSESQLNNCSFNCCKSILYSNLFTAIVSIFLLKNFNLMTK